MWRSGVLALMEEARFARIFSLVFAFWLSSTHEGFGSVPRPWAPPQSQRYLLLVVVGEFEKREVVVELGSEIGLGVLIFGFSNGINPVGVLAFHGLEEVLRQVSLRVKVGLTCLV